MNNSVNDFDVKEIDRLLAMEDNSSPDVLEVELRPEYILTPAEALLIADQALHASGIILADAAPKPLRVHLNIAKVANVAAAILIFAGVTRAALEYKGRCEAIKLAENARDACLSKDHAMAVLRLEEYLQIEKDDLHAQLALAYQKAWASIRESGLNNETIPQAIVDRLDLELQISASQCHDDALLAQIAASRRELAENNATAILDQGMTIVYEEVPSSTMVPEPASIAIVALGFGVLIRRRGRRPA
jgi:hypothetical protein